MAAPSALQTLLQPSGDHYGMQLNDNHQRSFDGVAKEDDHFTNLALQVAHNLQHQHDWTNVQIHLHVSLTAPRQQQQDQRPRQRRPILSGLPPTRLYIHPDEQIEFLQRQHAAKTPLAHSVSRAASSAENLSAGAGGAKPGPDLSSSSAAAPSSSSTAPPAPTPLALDPEREWVLPTHLREKWSLRRFAEVFDGLPSIAPPDGVAGEVGEGGGGAGEDSWRLRLPKRLLLATVDDDSSVVYYVVHDGLVKPRQN